jgi:hypothetical protein
MTIHHMLMQTVAKLDKSVMTDHKRKIAKSVMADQRKNYIAEFYFIH